MSEIEKMKNRKELQKTIKLILENNPVDTWEFPVVLSLCEGIGKPEFRIMIERSSPDHFVDAEGQKWVKA